MKKNLSYKRSLRSLVFITIILSFTSAFSQYPRLDGYLQRSFTSPFVSIKGASGSTYFMMMLKANINGSVATSIPFNFAYDGVMYNAGSTLWLNTSGEVNFGTSIASQYSRIVPYFGANPANYPNAICPFSGIQRGIYGVTTLVSGIAPNRVFTIEWSNVLSYFQNMSNTPNTSYQIKLYETSNVIEFWYQDYNYSFGQYPEDSFSDYYQNVGLNGNTSPSFEQIVTIGGTSNFSTPLTNYRYIPPSPELWLTPKNLSFGTVATGSSKTLTATISNVGQSGSNALLVVSNIAIVGNQDFTVIGGLPVPPLAVGQSQTITIQFSPQLSGNRVADLRVASNGLDSGLQDITLNGVGFAPNITVDSIDRFRRTLTSLGSTRTQWVHITSNGLAALFFSGFPITGLDSSQYFISHFPSNTIPANGVDSLGITYVPTLEGKHVAVVTILSNAANAPSIPILLHGIGIIPKIVINPTHLFFDSVSEGERSCQTIDIWNPGTDTLRLKKNFLTSNDGDFHYIGLTGSDTAIPPDQHKMVTICFEPIQQGYRQARLLFQTNIINTFETPRRDTGSIYNIDMNGSGIPRGIFETSGKVISIFDSTLVGTTLCHTDTLKNTGDADITVTGISFTGANANNFNQSGLTFPFQLKAHSSIAYNICGTPDQLGIRSSQLNFIGISSGKIIGLTNPLGVFGFKACISAIPQALFTGVVLPNNGSDSIECVKIINCGDIAATYSVSISGTAKADYSVTPATSSIISSKDTATFCITYKPSVVRQSPASLDVTTADNSVSVSVPLAGADGCAVMMHEVAVIPNTMAFEKSQFSIDITNSGTYPWGSGAGIINGSGASMFKIDSIVPDPIPANVTGKIYMTFAPTSVNDFTANLTFPNAGPCEDGVTSIDLNAKSILSSVKEITSDGFSLEPSYPNPAQGKTSFNYTTPFDAEVRITLNDLTGNLMKTIISGRISAGAHSVSLDISNLPSGTYIYVLESGFTRLVRQLILTK